MKNNIIKSLHSDNLPNDAKKFVSENKVVLKANFFKGNTEERYSKLRFKEIYKGYDFLQNFAFVRTYIHKKYNLKNIALLEIILFITPLNLFTINDLRKVSGLRYSYGRAYILIDLGIIRIASRSKDSAKHIYAPTLLARKIVKEFYEMLAGEIPIPTNELESSTVKLDRVKANLIKELNKIERKPHIKTLWDRQKKTN